MNKVTALIISLIILAFGGLIVVYKINEPKDPLNIDGYETGKIVEENDKNGNTGDHIRGNKDSKVFVVEYADPQCPGCAGAMKTINKVYEKYGDRVAFTYRYYLLSYHPNAASAAAAAEAAGYQGYFWEMIDGLYEYRDTWVNATGMERTNAYKSIFEIVAPDGDVEKWRKDISSDRVAKKIEFDHALAVKDKLDATPSFYVNGKHIDFVAAEAETQDDIYNLIVEAIEKELAEEE